MLLSVVCVLAVAHLSQAQDWQLVWEDNFDFLDLNKWDHEITAAGGGNGEFQTYTQDPVNSFVRDGVLFIKATLTPNNTNPLTGEPFGEDFLVNGVFNVTEMYGRCTNDDNSGCMKTGQSGDIPPTMSARLRTYQRFAFKYGRAEVRAKMPAGDWFWPAIWLLPEDWVYGAWPRSGEIDMVEIIGNPDLIKEDTRITVGSDKMGSALHWGTRDGENKFDLTHNATYNTTHIYSHHFHDYAMEWSDNGFQFFTDGELILTIPNPLIDQNPSWQGFWEFGKPWSVGQTNPWANGTNMAPFDQSFHFLMNVAVGSIGGYIPDDVINRGGRYPKPWLNTEGYPQGMQSFWDKRDEWYWTWTTEGDNAAMQVDYIRVYQRA